MVSIVCCSCLSNVPVKDNIDGSSMPPVCFEAKYKVDDGTVRAWGCYENKDLCDKALKAAKKYGSLVKIKSISECRFIK